MKNEVSQEVLFIPNEYLKGSMRQPGVTKSNYLKEAIDEAIKELMRKRFLNEKS